LWTRAVSKMTSSWRSSRAALPTRLRKLIHERGERIRFEALDSLKRCSSGYPLLRRFSCSEATDGA
jgi:hypothetical protein